MYVCNKVVAVHTNYTYLPNYLCRYLDHIHDVGATTTSYLYR